MRVLCYPSEIICHNFVVDRFGGIEIDSEPSVVDVRVLFIKIALNEDANGL